MVSDLIILNSFIIVMFSIFMVLDSTSLKLSLVWSISICKEWSIGKIEVASFYSTFLINYHTHEYVQC